MTVNVAVAPSLAVWSVGWAVISGPPSSNATTNAAHGSEAPELLLFDCVHAPVLPAPVLSPLKTWMRFAVLLTRVVSVGDVAVARGQERLDASLLDDPAEVERLARIADRRQPHPCETTSEKDKEGQR